MSESAVWLAVDPYRLRDLAICTMTDNSSGRIESTRTSVSDDAHVFHTRNTDTQAAFESLPPLTALQHQGLSHLSLRAPTPDDGGPLLFLCADDGAVGLECKVDEVKDRGVAVAV